MSSEGAISQEEIDALLSGVESGGLSGAYSSSTPSAGNMDIPTLQKFADDMKGKLENNISTMTGSTVEIGEPVVEASNRDQLLARIPEIPVSVTADFNAGLVGDHLFVMAPELVQKISSLVNNEPNAEMDDMAISMAGEMVSNHSGAEITALSQGGKLPGLAANPAEALSQPKPMIRMPQGSFALFTYPITLDGSPYTLWEAVSSSVAEGMATALGGGVQKRHRRQHRSAQHHNSINSP